MSKYQLISRIIQLSVAKTWDEARLEWSLFDVCMAEIPETCICGHYPIIELCTITNTHNQNTVTVGNCCVKKFIGLPSDKIFQSVKRVQKDLQKSLNMESIEHAFQRGWINRWERDFCVSNLRKRLLSEKQLAKRAQINIKVLSRIRRHALL